MSLWLISSSASAESTNAQHGLLGVFGRGSVHRAAVTALRRGPSRQMPGHSLIARDPSRRAPIPIDLAAICETVSAGTHDPTDLGSASLLD